MFCTRTVDFEGWWLLLMYSNNFFKGVKYKFFKEVNK